MYLVIDTETTGPDANTAEMCELASLACDQITVQSKLFNTHTPISTQATAKNNITVQMLSVCAYPEQAIDEISKLLHLENNQYDYYVGHNIQYDTAIISNCLNRIGRTDLQSIFNSRKTICTMRLAQHLLMDLATEDSEFSFSQDYLKYFLEISEVENLTSHRAASDVVVCKKIFEKLIELYNEINQTQSSLEEIYQFQKLPINWPFMPWGKHRRKTWGQIPKSYLMWMLENMDCFNPASASYNLDLVNSLENYLENCND